MRVRYRYFYTNDFLTIFLCFFFAFCSFFNVGKRTLTLDLLWHISLDRELVFGSIFLFIPVLLFLYYRWTNASAGRIAKFFRLFYVQLLYALFFKESIILSQLFYSGRSLDLLFARADQLLFNSQPAAQFYLTLPDYPIITEVFFFGYFFYYILVISSFWMLYIKGEKKEAACALVVITSSLYMLYIFFIFFPVQGPKYFFPELRNLWYTNFHGFLITGLMKSIFNNMNLAGAAFPSSHVALSLIALILNWKYNLPLALIFLPFTLILFVSTVYIYAHYVVDVFGGIAAGIALYFLIPLCIRRVDTIMVKLDMWLGKHLRLKALSLFTFC